MIVLKRLYGDHRAIIYTIPVLCLSANCHEAMMAAHEELSRGYDGLSRSAMGEIARFDRFAVWFFIIFHGRFLERIENVSRSRSYRYDYAEKDPHTRHIIIARHTRHRRYTMHIRHAISHKALMRLIDTTCT
jgi:hypothetical protein